MGIHSASLAINLRSQRKKKIAAMTAELAELDSSSQHPATQLDDTVGGWTYYGHR